ncbi:hypothetical protein DdX_19813 [Ditylenchus destructor]|uniref:Uncharacterized protein n=1 Tax=Ditylenchus destructor TaxID=166010 RepID=A0AAD4MHS3_9BILA|nr:hypothetical protein DdX_19813 [Ditylenchus destructor]
MGNTISIFLEWQENLPHRKVEISDDCWLDVLKFLICAQWSEKRYVSRQINGIADRNISRLPRATIERAILGENSSMPNQLRNLSLNALVAFGAVIPKSEIEQWFVNHGVSLEAKIQFRPLPDDLYQQSYDYYQHRAVLMEFLSEGPIFGGYDADFVDICVLGPARQSAQVQPWWFHQLFRKQYESVLYYAQLYPYANYSWAAMEQFLTFLIHPLSYIKVVEMYTVNQKLVDVVKNRLANIQGDVMGTQKLDTYKPAYIHCETFSLLFESVMNVDGLCYALTWLERNVRADAIQMPFVSLFTDSQDHDTICQMTIVLNNFVFGALRICAKRELRVHSKIHSEIETNLIISLVEKFRSLPLIEREIPTIVIESIFSIDFRDVQQNLGSNVIHHEVDSQGAEFLYVFENGQNRMRISFCQTADYWYKYDCYVKFYATQHFL